MPFHLPILRRGRPYTSLDVARVPDHRTREVFVEVSQANPGLIRRDLRDQKTARTALANHSTAELVSICERAADHFANDTLALGADAQTPQDYVEQVSATTGLPHVLVRRNLLKIRAMFAEMRNVLNGLTRNLDWELLDRGFGEADGRSISFFPRTDSLGVVLPNNSPGVHSLWIPAVPLKTPLVLKPGSAEPWTPYRIIQALIKAGAPAEAFSFYPADHAAAAEILRGCGRGMMFGDSSSTGIWEGDGRIEVHGPGFSKILIGEDCIEEWETYLDVMFSSITDNGGRSCVNASGVWVPRYGKQIAQALAARAAKIIPRAADDEAAQLAPFVDSNVANRIDQIIDQGLHEAGAGEVTSRYREHRLQVWNGCTYLLPTIVQCDTAHHVLANKEFLFPYASVVEVDSAELPEVLGPSLVVTAITRDQNLIRRLVGAANVDRLNIGPVATNHISWDQPHEGNLFDHLYGRRAFQLALAG